MDLGSAGESVRRVRCVRFLRRHATGQAPVELHTVHSEVRPRNVDVVANSPPAQELLTNVIRCVQRGLEWSLAMEKLSEASLPEEGFYVSRAARNGKLTAVLCLAHVPARPERRERDRAAAKKERMFQIYK